MKEDPRLIATRETALEAAQNILLEQGVLSLTHGAVSKLTGISRSTLYRHWPDVEALRDATFKRVSTPPNIAPQTNGPLRADLFWLLSILMGALNETPWGRVAPQVIAAAATDPDARLVITDFMKDRFAAVEAIFDAAKERGEIAPDRAVQHLIEIAISVPYFRKLVLDKPLNDDWLRAHVDMVASLAEQ
ncbi:MAG: TetR/AcrR family transcriptional regulator C-terminal ligand-binding domain-containing protein [Pseudomonadota bacterium]